MKNPVKNVLTVIAILILVISLLSCNNSNKRSSEKKTTNVSSEVTDEQLSENKEGNAIEEYDEGDDGDIWEELTEEDKRYLSPKDGTLPFGHIKTIGLPHLITHDEEAYQDTSNWYRTYMNLLIYYNNLSRHTKLVYPIIDNTEHIKLGFRYPFINSMPLYKGDLAYKLPDFGIYQCYYVNEFLATSIPLSIKDEDINEVSKDFNRNEINYLNGWGSLLLYDKTTKSAKVINVYHNIAVSNWKGNRRPEDSVVKITNTPYFYKRLFYIGKDKIIRIFTTRMDYLAKNITTKNDFNIEVSDKGEVIVKDSSDKIIKTYQR